MNTNDARVAARSRARRRLRRMTIGTAMLGIAATGGLGWAAALSYDGSTPASAATTAVVTADSDTSTTSSATTSTTTTAPATTAPTVTSVTGSAHASTGGS